MKRLLFCVVCLFTMFTLSTAEAQNWNRGYNPNPAWCPPKPRTNYSTGMEPGSFLNPYTIKDRNSGRTYTIRPEFPSSSFGIPAPDWMAPGTSMNPWVIEAR